MWVHTVPSIRRTAAPRGHLVECAAWPPLLLTHQTFLPVINTHIRNARTYCRSKQKMNQITGRRQRSLLCSGKQVPKNKTKLNNNLQKLQSRNIKQIFPQTAFICSIWSHWPLLSTHQVLFQAKQLRLAQPCHWLLQPNLSEPASLSLFFHVQGGECIYPNVLQDKQYISCLHASGNTSWGTQ